MYGCRTCRTYCGKHVVIDVEIGGPFGLTHVD